MLSLKNIKKQLDFIKKMKERKRISLPKRSSRRLNKQIDFAMIPENISEQDIHAVLS